MDTQDFTHGVDFTAISPQTASMHNQLIDLAVPEQDTTPDTGKGLLLTTIDSAVGVPSVPDAATNLKWKRYQWQRKPHAADTNRIVRIYIWDEVSASDATYLKWLQVQTDISSLSTDVATALADSAAAVTTANGAATTANAATVTANTALAAVTTASNDATNALAAASAAQSTANNANTTAATANANATAALAAVAAPATISDLPVGTTEGQIYRANKTKSAMEFVTVQNEYVACRYIQNKGTHGGTMTTGVNLIPFNDKLSDLGGICTLAANKITLPPGVYTVSAFITGYATGGIQAFLINDADNSVLIEGKSEGAPASANVTSEIRGLLVITNANGNMTIRVDCYSTQTQATTGMGVAVNKNPSGSSPHEVYDIIEFMRIGYKA